MSKGGLFVGMGVFVDKVVRAYLEKYDAEEEYDIILAKISGEYNQLPDAPVKAITDKKTDAYNPEDNLVDADTLTIEDLRTEPTEKKVLDISHLGITDMSKKNFTISAKHPAYKKVMATKLYQDARIFPNYSPIIDKTECYFMTQLFPLELVMGEPIPLEMYEPILDECIKRGDITIKNDAGDGKVEISCMMQNPTGPIEVALEMMGIRDKFKIYQVGIQYASNKFKSEFWSDTCEMLGYTFTAMCGITESGGTHWRTGNVKGRMIMDPWHPDYCIPIVREHKRVLYYFVPKNGYIG